MKPLDHALSCVQISLKFPSWEPWNVAVAAVVAAAVAVAAVAVGDELFWHSHRSPVMVVQEVGTVGREAKNGRPSLD